MNLVVSNKSAPTLMQPPPGVDAPLMDTAEIVYISSLALLKVGKLQTKSF